MRNNRNSAAIIDASISVRIVDIQHKITGAKVNFIKEGGVMISTVQPERIGTFY